MAGSAFERLKKEFSVLKETTKDEFVIRQESDRKDREAKDRRMGGATPEERTENFRNFLDGNRNNDFLNNQERENKSETAGQKKTERNNTPSNNDSDAYSNNNDENADNDDENNSNSSESTFENENGNASDVNNEVSDIADELEDVTNNLDDSKNSDSNALDAPISTSSPIDSDSNDDDTFDEENKDNETSAEDSDSENIEEVANEEDENSENSEGQVEESSQEDADDEQPSDNDGEDLSDNDGEDLSENNDEDSDSESSDSSNNSSEVSNESSENKPDASNAENSSNAALGTNLPSPSGDVPSSDSTGGQDSSGSSKEEKGSSKEKKESDEKQSKREAIKNKVNEKTKAAIAKNRAVRAVREAKRKIQNAAKTVKNGVMAIIKGIWIIIKGFIMPPFIGFWIILAIFLSLFVGGALQTLGQNENRCFAGINGTGFTARASTEEDANDRMLENASIIFDWLQQTRFLFLDGFGMNRNQAAAFVGNIAAENASFDPSVTQIIDGSPQGWCAGCSNADLLARRTEMENEDMGRGIGIIQWDNGRNTALVLFAEELNTPWYDLDTQLNFLRFELDILNGGELGQYLLDNDFNVPARARTASRLAYIVSRHFFRCRDCRLMGENSLGQPISIAETTATVQARMQNAAEIANGRFGLFPTRPANHCAQHSLHDMMFSCEDDSFDIGSFLQIPNGQHSMEQLQELSFHARNPSSSGTWGLRCDAAAALELLNELYFMDFGRNLPASSGYRALSDQRVCFGCATPGRSMHGYAIAMDFGGMGFEHGITSSNPAFHGARFNWLRDNGPQFGWDIPNWACPGGSLPEPWHWEFWHDRSSSHVGRPCHAPEIMTMFGE